MVFARKKTLIQLNASWYGWWFSCQIRTDFPFAFKKTTVIVFSHQNGTRCLFWIQNIILMTVLVQQSNKFKLSVWMTFFSLNCKIFFESHWKWSQITLIKSHLDLHQLVYSYKCSCHRVWHTRKKKSILLRPTKSIRLRSLSKQRKNYLTLKPNARRDGIILID